MLRKRLALLRRSVGVPLAVLSSSLGFADAQSKSIEITLSNWSEPSVCAERDNVDLSLSSGEIKRFHIRAIHPAYIGALLVDRSEADWTDCGDVPTSPVSAVLPQPVALYDAPDIRLVGYTFPSFWRPNSVPVRVGDRVTDGLHLVQLWVGQKGRAEEVLVLYPPDGYWRARPMAPDHLRSTAYGSSFLVGPVEHVGRPVVELKEVVFDPIRRSFRLGFRNGGAATLQLEAIDQDQILLNVEFDEVADLSRPFASFRSMFVTEFNADAAHVAWRGAKDRTWRSKPVMQFEGGHAVAVWMGRLSFSRHNTSAPDMVFDRFESGVQK